VKSRGDAVALARDRKGDSELKMGADAEIVFKRLDELQRQIEDNETKGDVESALAAARDFTAVAANVEVEKHPDRGPKVAAGWNQVGLLYRSEGDIDEAEQALAKANEINRKTLGDQHEATRQTCYHLASVYQGAMTSYGGYGSYGSYGSYGAHMMKSAPPAPSTPHVSAKANHPRDESLARFQARMDRPEARKHVRESVLPVLKKALQEAQTAQERTHLAIALGNLGPLAQDAEPMVRNCLDKARDANELGAFVQALNQMGPPSKDAVPILVDALKKCEADPVRRSIATYLAQASEGQAQLTELAAQSKKDTLRQIAAEALQRPRGGR
jgi:tetratricopeptide (TPR) repeat protein